MKRMFSARQLAMSEKPPSDQESAANGFARVLTSLQGLQQRLDDFSVEEVSRAHARTLDLIRDLDLLQRNLDLVRGIKEVGAAARAAMDAQPDILADSIDTDNDGLTGHPRLRALVRAGKLFEKYRRIKFLKGLDPALPEPRTEPPANLSASASPPAANTLPVIARFEQPVKANELHQVNKANRIESGVGFILLNTAGAPSHSTTGREPAESRSPARSDSGTGLRNAAPNHEFDERLLKDLIDTYGEFSSLQGNEAPRSSSPETAVTGASLRATAPPKAAPSAERPHAAVVAKQPSLTAVAPEPAFVQERTSNQLALPAPGKKTLSETSVPNIKARGEIDRQLKSIIKDYGQVDLYSHRDTVSSKTRAMAAAGLLALVLAGFYFFVMPSSTSQKPSDPAAISEPAESFTNAVRHPPQQK